MYSNEEEWKREQLALEVAGLRYANLGRQRGAYFTKEEGRIAVVVNTRNGKGNRDCTCYGCSEDSSGEAGSCTGCVMTGLDYYPNYIRDEDCDYDGTYADIYFSILPEYMEKIKAIHEKTPLVDGDLFDEEDDEEEEEEEENDSGEKEVEDHFSESRRW